jgi:hypothetical protein
VDEGWKLIMANEQNLKKFKKRQSGNPAGRPKLRLNEVAKEHAEALAPDDLMDSLLTAAVEKAKAEGRDPEKDLKVRQLKGRRRIEVILDELYTGALKFHSVRAAEEYLSRALGKPAQALTVDGTITQLSAAEHVSSILESLSALQSDNDEPGTGHIN